MKSLHKELQEAQEEDRKQKINEKITDQMIHLKDKLIQQATRERLRIDTIQGKDKGRDTEKKGTQNDQYRSKWTGNKGT